MSARDMKVTVAFEVDDETLPALYSAVEEVSNSVGTRLEEAKLFAREDALTRAARALGALRAGISSAHRKLAAERPNDRRWQSPLGDRDFR